MKKNDYFFTLLMNKQIIIDLMSANADDAELVALCTEVIKDIKSNEANFVLSQCVQAKNIPADEYLREFHDVCYIDGCEYKTYSTSKEWRNGKGQAHCLTKDKDGNILPARITMGGWKFWCKDGEVFSPGVDKDGYSLPMVMTFYGTKIWVNKDDENHRLEFDKDGNLLPAILHPSSGGYYFINGQMVKKDKYVSLKDVKRILF